MPRLLQGQRLCGPNHLFGGDLLEMVSGAWKYWKSWIRWKWLEGGQEAKCLDTSQGGERASCRDWLSPQRGKLGISNAQLCLQVSMHLLVDRTPTRLDKCQVLGARFGWTLYGEWRPSEMSQFMGFAVEDYPNRTTLPSPKVFGTSPWVVPGR